MPYTSRLLLWCLAAGSVTSLRVLPKRLAIERQSVAVLSPSDGEPPFPNASLFCVVDRTTDVTARVDGFKLMLPGWTRGTIGFDGLVIAATHRGKSLECNVPKVRSMMRQPLQL
jgi:hypothetical protein